MGQIRSPRARRALSGLLAVGLGALGAGCAADGPYADSARPTPEERLMREPDGAARALARVARATRDAGDPISALNVYKRAHAMAPRDAGILIEMGETLSAIGAYNEAREALARAVRMTEKNTRALRGLGNALVGLNEPALAIQNYQKALAVKPEAATYAGLGVAHDLMGDSAAAEAAYRSGLELAPGNAALKGNLALSLALAGRYDEAIALLSELMQANASTARTRQNLALVYGLAGRLDEARTVLRIDLDPRAVANNVAYYEMLRDLPKDELRTAILAARTVRTRARAALGPAAPPPPEAHPWQ